MNRRATNQAPQDAIPDVPVAQWGRRLADAVREAIAAGDAGAARRLALDGDGQARSLAKEYTFMVRGLGITIRVILDLLRQTAGAGRADVSSATELGGLVDRFSRDLSCVVDDAETGRVPHVDPKIPLARLIETAADALAGREERFVREQADLARRFVQAIDAGDTALALEVLAAREQGHYLPLHDCFVRFMAESFGWVLRHFGEPALLRFHLDTAQGQRAGFDKWEQMSAAQFAWTSAFLLKQHMGRVTVCEDAEKFTIEQTPCGSGGRLQLAGAYRGVGALPQVERPGALTFGRPRLPVYCSHCPVWNGVAPLRWYGRAHWVFSDPARADGGCTLHIYKRHDATPPEYAALLSGS